MFQAMSQRFQVLFINKKKKKHFELFCSNSKLLINDRIFYFSDEQLVTLLLDFFMAGTETTSNTLSMAMLYMIMYPEIQDKVHQNVDDCVPDGRLPTLQDRTK